MKSIRNLSASENPTNIQDGIAKLLSLAAVFLVGTGFGMLFELIVSAVK